MKSALLLLALVGIVVAIPLPLLKRQTTPSGALPPNGQVMSSTCRCYAVTQDQLACLTTQSATLMNSQYCECFEEFITLPASCPIHPTGAAGNQTLACPDSWWLKNFDIFALDSVNISSFASIDGRLAAVNNVWLSGFKVGYSPLGHADMDEASTSKIIDTPCSSLGASDWRYTVVAGKALNLANGKVYSGDALYGSSATIGNDVTFSTACQRVMNASVINWTFAQSEISRIAAGLKAMPANGQYSVSNGVLTLSGPAQFVSGSLLVFSVKLLDLLGAQSISFSNFPKAADIKAIVFNADVSGFTIPDNFAFSLPQSWSLSALEGSDYKNKLIWNFDQLAASLSFSNTDNSTHEVFGAVLAPNVALNCGASRMKIYGSLFLKSLSGMYLISEHLSSDFCLADLVSVAITTQPATLPATTQPATVTPTMVQTVTTFVPSVIGTTKIPATTQPAK